MDDDGGKRKRIALMGISSLLLVAMVVAVTVGSSSNVKKESEVSSSMKSIQAICQPTDFKETCVSSLSKVAHNSSDPKELIKASFEVAMDEINNVVNNSTLFKELQKDPKIKKAADDCKELFQDAVDDFRRSFNEFEQFQYYDLERVLSNMKVWLSATITYQETCLDGFENTTGDASEKMRELLKNAMEMSSNGLAIVTEMSHIVSTMQFTSFKRGLLSVQDNRNDVLDKIDSLIRLRRLLAADGAQILEYDDDALRIIKGRRLLISTPNMVDRDGLPGWLDEKRSKLLQAASPSSSMPRKEFTTST